MMFTNFSYRHIDAVQTLESKLVLLRRSRQIEKTLKLIIENIVELKKRLESAANKGSRVHSWRFSASVAYLGEKRQHCRSSM
jgi:hypothetical protein